MIALWYALFALFSTAVNIAFQYISFLVYEGFLSLYVAMFIGTVAGLVLKYILDKKYIFFHKPKSKKDDGKKFFLYSLMGVFTTLIFWGFEIGFDAMFESQNAKYIGAVVGLSIGYVVKYFLDKKFVFKD
ncbi:MAG: polysaccharide biosynthesis protein GtrA [Sulfurimonas sp. RIFCSPHIGHO2_12_FULL_36_9]|uniref:GtrA family protein n=1 Tax=Sulfurimonas sp. RIFCSPLOWO2_12_36_12 TaxID=1802253 RepID=UPI0008D1CF06|nr:GtrA family protein [Sulfurimonas sp. RIFCSPLOWO2_12_36_12]OHD96379.1 MAG: polysaccharide biosynthesis protein GtrA [Sulfurimonas sp. RIFCSPHIGHO2_12_FULL_36_9]OHD97539.1 MAG: polysaccharide biosynthesis protein GtrA [Sulfurimonas sp. RIFCSPLOWO2_02_FULL_36_28]OHE02464.1 MAG: polysaccharide biosynthesis protein GtrA [Sulfurimonas sp. RIFCSPLOWO2_12_36_12]